MAERIKKAGAVYETRPVSLGRADSRLRPRGDRDGRARGIGGGARAARYERNSARVGYRNGAKPRTLTGLTGLLPLTLPRGLLHTPGGAKEWTSTIVARYERRLPEVNEAVVATYLAGSNMRRIRGALRPLLKAAPLSKSAVSRVVATLKAGLEAWQKQSLAGPGRRLPLPRRHLPAGAQCRQGGQPAHPRRGGGPG
jgi:hypothetical protein